MSETPNTSRQASPVRSLRSRMGTMLRRNSSGFGFSRPTTPLRRSDSKTSLRLSTDSGPAPSQDHHVPSPVQESPAREAEAEQPSAPAAPAPSSLSKEVTSSPEAAPVQLTAEPEPTIHAPAAPIEQPVQPKSDVAAQTSATVPSQPPTEEHRPEPEPQTVTASTAAKAAAEVQPVVHEERAADAFAWSDDQKPKPAVVEDIPAESPPPARAPSIVAEPDSIPTSTQEAKVNPAPSEAHDTGFAWKDDTQSRVVTPRHSSSSLANVSSSGAPLVASPESTSRNLSPKGSKSSLSSSYGHVVVSAAGRRVSVSVDPNEGEIRRGRTSRSSSIRVSFDDSNADPFADPPAPQTMPVPSRMLSPIDSIAEPAESPRELQDTELTGNQRVSILPYTEEHTYASMPGPVIMPLPPAASVISAHKPVKQVPSAYSLNERANGHTDHDPHETDERLPLLPRGMDQNAGTSKSAIHADVSSHSAVVFPSGPALWPTPAQSLQSLGWTEFLLPDSSIYYHHRGMRITTDIILRNTKKLEAVTEYLDRKLPEEVSLAPEGWELWLRDADISKHGFSPIRSWVNHNAKALSFDPPPARAGEVATLPDHITDDDRLDMEYRYWAFVEGHPSHILLPESAHREAMDALQWSYTDCLLPTNQPTPPPFLPHECQELMGLLHSFEDSSSKMNSVIHTRVVSRVLIRVAQWRQQYFRPNKPLPRDTAKGTVRPEHRLTFRRAVLDVAMSIICLGIPYLFMDRSRGRRIDEESGLQSAGPILMIGSCACLVSAVILSASVTFMTLPGLDDVARLAGMIAILFSASSMVSSVFALFRYKADVERTVVYVGGEGLMLLSQRSIVMSLPLVFLAWAIAAFVTGITFYSFRGATLTSRVVIKAPFQDYTHWAMVGTLGGLAGILMMSALLARR